MAKGRLFGPSAKGVVRGGKQAGNLSAPAGMVNMTNPSLSGAPDVVQARTAQAIQGTMQQKQMKKNKSKGLTP